MALNRILVVDDDLDTCCSIKGHMQNEGVEVCCMTSASEALESVMNTEYCLILLSNQLPGISGMETVRIMRLTLHIPIIILADQLSSNDKAALLRAGADAIIDKPLNVELCAAQADALIQLYRNSDVDHGNAQREQIAFGSKLMIIPHFRQVFVNGKPVSLTRKEFDLLHFFARHPHQVYSREQLYARVWGDSYALVGDETVKVHIQTLRKKIETDGTTFIHNVWGVGYKFAPPNE